MNNLITTAIINSIEPGNVVSKQDIYKIALEADNSFNYISIRNLIDNLLKNELFTRVGRNSYVREAGTPKPVYEGPYTEDALGLIQRIDKKFPLLAFQVWELRWLNEFLNHQIWANAIFIDVEKCGTGFVFDELYDDYMGKILLKPDEDQVFLYSSNGSLIVGNLVSEAPQADKRGITPLERIMVDLVANKVLRSMISTGEIPDVIREMYDKYRVDELKLMRYARRRHQDDKISDILEDRLVTGRNTYDKERVL